MNLRLFSLALLISALPPMAFAGTNISFNKGDFIAAEKISKDGETIVSVRLSKSGKAKIKKLNRLTSNREGHTEIAGVTSDFN